MPTANLPGSTRSRQLAPPAITHSAWSLIQRQLSAFLACYLLVQPALATAADWPHWRGPTRDGISPETGWTSDWSGAGPAIRWRAQVGTGFSTVAVNVGRVFTMGNENGTDTVHALDAESGIVLWRHSYPCELDPRYYEGGPGATPTVDGDRVYTFSKKGHVFCLQAATGQVIWSADIREALSLELPEWSFAGSPLIHGDLVILNAGPAGTALDKHTGKIAWSSGTGRSGYATPLPFTHAGRDGVAIFSAKALLAVEPGTGRELWRFPWESSREVNAADPLIHGNRMFISTSTGSALLEFSDRHITPVWVKKGFFINYFNPAVLLDGHIYGLDGTTHRPTALICIELESGELKWKQAGFGSGGWMAADGKLIILDKGELIIVAAAPSGYRELARTQVLGGKCWTAPVLANGRIYGRNAKGDLVCVDVRQDRR